MLAACCVHAPTARVWLTYRATRVHGCEHEDAHAATDPRRCRHIQLTRPRDKSFDTTCSGVADHRRMPCSA